MDTLTLVVLLAALGFFLVRLAMIAVRLRQAAKDPSGVDKSALQEARASLRAQQAQSRRALREPRRQLRAARASVRRESPLLPRVSPPPVPPAPGNPKS